MGKNVSNERGQNKPNTKNELMRGGYNAVPNITLNGKSIDDILKRSSKVSIIKQVGHVDKVEIECYGVVDVDVDTNRILLSIIDRHTGSAYDKKYVLLAEENDSSIFCLKYDVIYRALEEAKDKAQSEIKNGFDVKKLKKADEYDRELEKIDKILWKE